LLKRVPVFRETVRRWLKSGIIEFGKYFQPKSGTLQGGIISPLLANIALDGMERLFDAENLVNFISILIGQSSLMLK